MSYWAKYTVYDKKTDMPLIIGGTSAECAAAMGLTVPSFYSECSKLKHGKLESSKWEIFRDNGGEEVDVDD